MLTVWLLGCGGAPVGLEAPVLTVTPAEATTPVGGSVTLALEANDRVDGGALTPGLRADAGRLAIADGAATWSAPWTPGTYEIEAWHPQSASTRARVTVTVTARAAADAPVPAPGAVAAVPDALWTGQAAVPSPYYAGDGVRMVPDPASPPTFALPCTTPASWAFDAPANRWVFACGVAGHGVQLYAVGMQSLDPVPVADFGAGSPTAVALIDNGRLAAVAEGSTVQLVEVDDGLVRDEVDVAAPVDELVWSDAVLAIGTGDRTTFWHLGTGDLLSSAVGGHALHWAEDVLFAVDDAGRPRAVPTVIDGSAVIDLPTLDGDPVTSGGTDALLDGDYVMAHASGHVRRVAPDGTVRWDVDLGEPARIEFEGGFQLRVWAASGVTTLHLDTGAPW